jgi:hypothetical protein
MIVEPAAGQPVVTGSASRWRLPVIALVAILAVGIGTVAGAFLIAGRGVGLSPAAQYVPADAVMYLEARLDLPGTQRAQLRAILERFPGIEADEILGQALADTLDKALADANASFDYSGDIAPWFDGQLALALLDYPMSADPMQMELPSMVALLGVRDPAAATALADELRGELEAAGASFSSGKNGDTTIWTLDPGDPALGAMPGLGFAYAVTDDQLLLASGSVEVATALDRRNGIGSSLADRAEVGQLAGHLSDERVGVMTVDGAAMLAELRAQLEASQPAMAQVLAGSLDNVPGFSISSISFENDAVRFDSVSSVPDGPLAPANAERAFAAQVPADAIFFADADGLGAGLEQGITAMKATLAVGPAAAEQLAQLEQFEAALGAPLEQFVSWAGGGAMVAGWDGEEPYVGLVLEATDADAARQRLNQLRALVELAAADPSAHFTVATESVGDTEVTTIKADLSSAGLSGMPLAVIEWAIDGDRVLLGVGDRFVRRLLDLDPADSLAQSDRFQAAVDRLGGTQNGGVVYVDLAALREAVVSALPPDALGPDWDRVVAPNLAPLDYLVVVNRVEGDALISRMALVLK